MFHHVHHTEVDHEHEADTLQRGLIANPGMVITHRQPRKKIEVAPS